MKCHIVIHIRDYGGLSLSGTVEIERKGDLEYSLEAERGMTGVKDGSFRAILCLL